MDRMGHLSQRIQKLRMDPFVPNTLQCMLALMYTSASSMVVVHPKIWKCLSDDNSQPRTLSGVMTDGSHYIQFKEFQTFTNQTVLQEAYSLAEQLLPPSLWQSIQTSAETWTNAMHDDFSKADAKNPIVDTNFLTHTQNEIFRIAMAKLLNSWKEPNFLGVIKDYKTAFNNLSICLAFAFNYTGGMPSRVTDLASCMYWNSISLDGPSCIHSSPSES